MSRQSITNRSIIHSSFDTPISLHESRGPAYEISEEPSMDEDYGIAMSIDEGKNNTKVPAAKQWSCRGEHITPVSESFPRLKAGYYGFGTNNEEGLFLYEVHVDHNKLYTMPNAVTEEIVGDIRKFWDSEETYKKYNRVCRRNYVLYSAPGTGKTSLISIMADILIKEHDGIVFYLSTGEELEWFTEVVRWVRAVEGQRKVIAIIEDIDTFTQQSSRVNSLLLNILDGNFKLNGLVIIATTNHIELLEDRYTNRPSRFDKVIEFPLPDEKVRRFFISHTIAPDDIKKINLDEWVTRTKGYTIDHINELILLFFVFGHTEEESFKAMDDMIRQAGNRVNRASKTMAINCIGFDSSIDNSC